MNHKPSQLVFPQDIHHHPWLRMALIPITIAFVSLACSVGMSGDDTPFFTAPGGEALWTPTPEFFQPVDIPSPIPPGDDQVVDETQADITISSDPKPGSDPAPVNDAPILYYTQAGDTLPVVAVRFGVQPGEITSPDALPEKSLLPPNQLLLIPHRLTNTTSTEKVIPDSEIVFSPSAADFDIEGFVNQAGGYLSQYNEWLGMTGKTSGAEIIRRVATENSINPRILLALLEYQSHWVYGQPGNLLQSEYALGRIELRRKGLYAQLVWAVNHLSVGYYGWREGLLTEIQFSDGVVARLAPELNAGTVALQYYFAHIYDTPGWVAALNPAEGVPALYTKMFGDSWIRALTYEPLYPPNLTQPRLTLPFLIGQLWSFTGGPHGAWEHDGARAALDFAPASTESGCTDSDAWVIAVSPGLITRTGNGVVIEDLDGDGVEQTGWVILYLHVSDARVEAGEWVEAGDLIGHPSCEGGTATGTHVHIARKYNGEWIAADGPISFTLSGWTAHSGEKEYQGYLARDGETIPASVFGSYESRIIRSRDDP